MLSVSTAHEHIMIHSIYKIMLKLVFCSYCFNKNISVWYSDSIFNGKSTISEADKKQSSLLSTILDSNSKGRPKSKAHKEKNNTYESANALYEDWEINLNAFKSRIFLLKSTKLKGRPSDLLSTAKVSDCMQLKILAPKQMLWRLQAGPAQIQASNTSETY